MSNLARLPTLQSPPQLVMSKLQPPQEPAQQEPRLAILGRLAKRSPRKLVLVHAPAGFGKTTLLLQYLAACRREKRRTLWLSLDAADNDLERFVRHLQVGWNASAQQPAHASGLIEQLALCVQPFSILLDEFEVIQAPDVLSLLQQLLEYLPPQGEVVISSRQIPALRLATLRARGQLLEIAREDLCLSLEETTRLLHARLPQELSAQDIGLLHSRTEGWVAAIQLLTLSLPRHSGPSALLHHFSGSHCELANYLTEDILLRLAPEQQEFLLASSVFEQFDAEACDWLMQRRDSREVLARLLRDNLFLLPLDSQGSLYRYHSLFVSYLRSQLARQPGDRHGQLQRRAAQWFIRQNRPIRAIDHLLLAGEAEAALELLEDHAQALLEDGRVRRLLRWFDQLPTDLLVNHPRLRLSYAWALILNRRHAEASSHIAAIKRDTPSEAAHAHTLECLMLAMSDRIEECFRACSEHLPQLSDGHPLQQGILVTIQSHHMIAANRYDEARQLMVQAIDQETQIRNTFIRTIGDYNEGWIELLQGRLIQAQVRLQTSYRSSWREGQKGVPGGRAMIGVPLAEVLYEMNRLEQARRLIGECLPYARQNGHVDALILSYVLLSRLAACEDDRETALRYLTELENIGLDLDLPRVRASARLEQARLHWLHGDLFLSERIVREVESMPLWQELAGYTLPAQEIETPQVMRWRLAVANGQAAVVEEDIRRACAQARQNLRLRRCLKLKLLLATALYAQGKQQAALQLISDALQLAGDEGFFRSFLDEGSALHPLLRLWQARQQHVPLPEGISASFVEQLFEQVGGEPPSAEASRGQTASKAAVIEPLSKRELQVLHYIAEGLRNREIADRIFLSETTVKAHLRRIHSKLDAHSRTQAVAIARRHGWI
ncbi:helix-turn-helix transcriptional regulator [Pseudomonas aeruginosa]|uniref:LuxR C-terminal-related transcriptional regulator n=1 Tax=Pseudomonas aeruginosa TaxID=287 RepID=UPI000FC3FBDD|nr:LuxR C-terminal-related transcriptional regulator [Pseudomonas aeruginosa]RUE31488.1 helix-turn-helix transcriptional regulator [Pseudomonas aeruginosa]